MLLFSSVPLAPNTHTLTDKPGSSSFLRLDMDCAFWGRGGEVLENWFLKTKFMLLDA